MAENEATNEATNEVPSEVTERQAAEILSMKCQTLRYHRRAGWLVADIWHEAAKPPMQVRPNIRYDGDRLRKLVAAGRQRTIYRAAEA